MYIYCKYVTWQRFFYSTFLLRNVEEFLRTVLFLLVFFFFHVFTSNTKHREILIVEEIKRRASVAVVVAFHAHHARIWL